MINKTWPQKFDLTHLLVRLLTNHGGRINKSKKCICVLSQPGEHSQKSCIEVRTTEEEGTLPYHNRYSLILALQLYDLPSFVAITSHIIT